MRIGKYNLRIIEPKRRSNIEPEFSIHLDYDDVQAFEQYIKDNSPYYVYFIRTTKRGFFQYALIRKDTLFYPQ